MNDLYRALGDISSIRRQVATSSRFHGYGPATLAATGGFAVLAAALQQLLIPDPVSHVNLYLGIWLATAFVSAALTAFQMRSRALRLHSPLSGEMIRMAVQQFLPSFVTGLLLTIVLVRSVSSSVWMLPAHWQLIYSLGIFSSCRFLPKAMLGAGAWYLLTGLLCLAVGEKNPLAPLQMGIPFAVGQGLIAVVLRFGNPGEEG